MSEVNKVTRIWASQSGTSAEGMSRREASAEGGGVGVRLEVPGSVVSSPAGSGRNSGRQRFFSYIQIKSELIFGHQCAARSLSMSGQIRDSKPKTAQIDVPEEL